MTIEAAPIAVDPSGDFLGVDGAWSTFSITVGTPPQQLQVLASTEVASTWVIVVDGCGPNDAANCTQARGGEYDDQKSSSWNPKNIFQLGAEDNLGYSGNAINGSYGYDTIGLPGKAGANNISVNHQVIAGLITEAFYVGSLGLSNQAINFTDSGDSSPSLLTSLKNENLIPSVSYSYTAGASYHSNGGVVASLTLGGYDASRFTPNDISFTFAPTVERQLVVAIQSITYSANKTQTPLLSEGILALVDSTVPYLWLPQQACSAFESAFGIIWDELHNLYLVSDTLHEKLVQENPSVTLQLANSLTGPSVNITLPYSSFDLVAQYPLVLNTSRYFPLQRASDDNSYTLGRTFLQESFLIVDYENSNFSISQATFDKDTPTHIVAISSTSTTGSNPSNPTPSSTTISKTSGHNSSGVGTGAIAGIAIAIVLVASLVGAFFLRKMLRKRREKKSIQFSGDPKEPDFLDIQKRYSSEDPEVEYKKPATVTVTTNEVPMTPQSPPEMDTNTMEYFGPKRAPSQRIELPGSPVNRSELSSPVPAPRSGASSPDPNQLRSELSTPEPMYSNPELPTPDPSHELPSPALSGPGFGAPSDSDRESALRSPLPIQRPTSNHFNSSESEAGFTRDGMPTRPFPHRRFGSDESGISLASSRPSNLHLRMDSSSSDSEAFIYSNKGLDAGDSSDPDIITPAAATTNKDVNNDDNKITHLDSPTSASDTDTNTQNIRIALSPSLAKTHNPHRYRTTHVDSSSESEAPTTSTARQIRVTLSTFHSSTSSRPALRRVSPRSPTAQTPTPTQTQAQRASVHSADAGSPSDSEAWQTRLESPSEGSVRSRFGSLKRLGSLGRRK